MDDLDKLKSVLRPDEVADILRVSRWTVYRMMDDGRLPSFDVGGQKRIRRADLAEFCTPDNLRDLY